MYYIISEVHGHYGEFEQRLRQISNIHKNMEEYNSTRQTFHSISEVSALFLFYRKYKK